MLQHFLLKIMMYNLRLSILFLGGKGLKEQIIRLCLVSKQNCEAMMFILNPNPRSLSC